MNIALIGADGQLGSDLAKDLKEHHVHLLYYPEFDITKSDKAKHILLRLQPDLIINTAAFNRVDECEDDLMEPFRLNAMAVRDLALTCRELGAGLVHFSTDYVFDGKKREPYVEDDLPRPLNVYGVSKLAGECFVQAALKKYYLIRTCGLYGVAGCWGKGTNFVDSMVSLGKKGGPVRVVNDQRVTPTSTAELSRSVYEMIFTEKYGLYHLTNEGDCTWYEFAQAIFELIGSKTQLIPVKSKDFGAKAIRPAFSVLENRNAKKIGLKPFSHWRESLKAYMTAKGYIKGGGD